MKFIVYIYVHKTCTFQDSKSELQGFLFSLAEKKEYRFVNQDRQKYKVSKKQFITLSLF